MPTLLLGILMFLSPTLALAQSSPMSPPYEPATIIDVKLHQSAGDSNHDNPLYEVSVKVKQTVYLVLTAPPDGSGTIRYAIGRELLVHVGDNTITWNDILGRSHEVPIIGRGPIADSSKSHTD
jgi:hypothetical protein